MTESDGRSAASHRFDHHQTEWLWPIDGEQQCERIAEEEAAAGRAATIVTVLPDSAEKYMSERFWEEA